MEKLVAVLVEVEGGESGDDGRGHRHLHTYVREAG
jgi:hypothetical protein